MIVDASVALAWFLDEPYSQQARALLLRSDLAAPSLLLAEAGHVLWRASRDGRLDADDASLALDAMSGAFAEMPDIASLAGDALAIARQVNHAVYDCFYMALARRLQRPLISQDRALIRAAKRLDGIEAMSLSDQSAQSG